jgi:phage replication initiation protein
VIFVEEGNPGDGMILGPPSRQGDTTQTEAAQLRWIAARKAADAAALASQAPCSNTGCSRGEDSALIDFLSVSIPRANYREPGGPVSQSLPEDDTDLKVAVVAMKNLAQIYFNGAFPLTCIEASRFVAKGLFGYRYSATLHVPGVEGPVGVMGVGGNNETVYISISGAGCPFLRELMRYRLSLDGIGATITRVDLAFDDFDGECLDVHLLATMAGQGVFNGDSKQETSRRLVSDLGSGKGSTLYIGKKGQKELCVYQKGLQLGIVGSPWTRAEVRLWSKNRLIPYDVLTSPGAYLVGAYPQLEKYLPAIAPKHARVLRAKAEATLEGVESWLRSAAGKSIGFLMRAAEHGAENPLEVVEALARPGKPKRFAGIVEEAAFQRVKSRRPPRLIPEISDDERLEALELSYQS